MNKPVPSQISPHASRRHFMRKLGLVTAGLAAAAPVNAEASTLRRWWRHPSRSERYRLYRRLRLRKRNAFYQRYHSALRIYRQRTVFHENNGDESSVSGYWANFTKTLPHNDLGEVDAAAYQALLDALESGKSADFERIPLASGAVAALANPQAALSFCLTGGDSHSFRMDAAPAFSSAETAAEMGEVYLHALLRDVPFSQYATDPLAQRAVAQLNAFSDFRGPKVGSQVTTGTLFRGETTGDLLGNYVSQFLLLPISESSSTRDQRYAVPIQDFDHMTNWSDWLNILRGGAPTTGTTFDPTKRYINTARDLAEFVHTDYSYQAYLQAALILLGRGTPTSPDNAYRNISNQGPFITFGGAEILNSVAAVALEALKAAWHQKWLVHRRLRPEVFGGRIDAHRRGVASYPIHPEILSSSILDDVFAQTGNYLLPMAYPEGSPTHPAYPAGHAAIAGACVTVLKAFFDEDDLLAEAVEVDSDSNATELRPYSGTDSLTVGHELDKLANNISLGRDLAGVHWRTDGTKGIDLGEQVAISYLRELKTTYNEPGASFSFTNFQGHRVHI